MERGGGGGRDRGRGVRKIRKGQKVEEEERKRKGRRWGEGGGRGKEGSEVPCTAQLTMSPTVLLIRTLTNAHFDNHDHNQVPSSSPQGW